MIVASRALRFLLLPAVLTTAAGLIVLIADDDGRHAAIAAMISQVAGDVAALSLTALAAARAAGRRRVMWSLVAAAFCGWLIGDSLHLGALLRGPGVATTPLADVAWLTFSALVIAAVALFYADLRTERGWEGALDAAAVTLAVSALAWAAILGPLHTTERLGTLDAVYSVVYPGSALVATAAAGWLVLRTRGGPRWLRLVLAALALQLVAEIIYVAEMLTATGARAGGAWLLFATAAWVWSFAAAAHLHAGDAGAPGRHDPAPTWSDAIPAGATLTAVGLLAWHEGALGLAVMGAASIAAARLVLTNRANARLLAERQHESLTDPLTGALNRRGLSRELGALTAQGRRAGTKISALAIDLDGFKAVNDSAGHVEGDRLLVHIAVGIRAHLRDRDLLFRVGGDEFVALLPHTRADEAMAVAERLRAAVTHAAASLEAAVTTSIGVAEGPTRWTAPETLLADADRALYRAKAEGRDRVVLSPLPRASGPGDVPAGI